MKSGLIAIIALVCLFLSTTAFAGMAVEYPAFTTLNGNTISGDKLNNSAVIISVMAEWCPPCYAEAVEIQKAYEIYKDKDVLFIGLFIQSSDAGIEKFVKRSGITFAVGTDDSLARQLGAWTVPVTFIIGKDGQIKRRYAGSINQPAIRRGIEEIQE